MSAQQPVIPQSVSIATLLLTLVSAVTLSVAFILPGEPIVEHIFSCCLLIIISIAAYYLTRFLKDQWRNIAFYIVFWGCLVWPFLNLMGKSELSPNGGLPLEMQMLISFRNASLVLAIFATNQLHCRVAALMSLFLLLFSSTLALNNYVVVLLCLYCAIGCTWLMSYYWYTIPGQEVAVRFCVPWTFLATVALLMSSVGLVTFLPEKSYAILMELMPTSGGTSQFDPNSRGGVGDGEEDVAGENPESVGFAESDIMLEDDGPSLYDVISDMYGEPFKVKKQERMIPLGPAKVSDNHEKPSENLRGSRKFPTLRNGPKKHRHLKSTKTKALIYLVGAVPAYFRMEAFDRFDGVSLHPAKYDEAPLSGTTRVNDANEFLLLDRTSHFCPTTDHYVLKIAGLDSSHLPTPEHLQKFKIPKLTTHGFLEWAQDEIIRIRGRKTIPGGQIWHAYAGRPDRQKISSQDFVLQTDLLEDSTSGINPKIAKLAQSWVENLDVGIPQIECIEAKLREDYILDPEYTFSENCADPVANFLFESRRGPDYMFATAAAVMLRSLNYPTRVATGFYAHPENFDYRTQHTNIFRSDIHFWTEVEIRTGSWMIVEPTPGYELRLAHPTLWQLVCQFAFVVMSYLYDNSHWVAFAMTLAIALWWRRKDIYNLSYYCYWYVRSFHSDERLAFDTLKLIQYRFKLAGFSYPKGMTIRHWVRYLESVNQVNDEEVWHFACTLEMLLYSTSVSDRSELNLKATCKSLVHRYSLGNLRKWVNRFTTNESVTHASSF